MKAPRVFIGLIEIAGYYGGLACGLREAGVNVTHVTAFENVFYGCAPARGSWVIAISNGLTRLYRRALKHRVTRWPFKPVRWLHLRLLFLWAVARHDVFIFGGGVTFLERRDLPLLKRLGKKLIFVFNGSDTRPPYMSGAYVVEPKVSPEELCAATAASKQLVREVERHADYCVNHPLAAHFHEKPFINYLFIGNPGYLDRAGDQQTASSTANSGERAVRVVHAPSLPALKGSAHFRAMVDRINACRPRIDYIEVRNRPHADVLRELARCDFVIDELYSDVSLAGLATEAASFGKPALVGGYGREALERARRTVRLPLDTYCHPERVEETLERLLTDEAWRRACGESARNFVRDQWQPRALAEKFLALIDDRAPPDWFFDPQDIEYLHGWGAAETAVRRGVESLITFGGVGALQLGDKPRLERAFAEFATGAAPPVGKPLA